MPRCGRAVFVDAADVLRWTRRDADVFAFRKRTRKRWLELI